MTLWRRSIISWLFLCLIIFLITQPGLAVEVPDFDLESESAILMDAESGRVLYEKNPHQQKPPASITKIMTMLLTMEALEEGRAQLTDKVPTSEHAAQMGGSQIWLEPGEEMTLKEMLKAIAIVSANDACVAVAEYLYGTEEEFVRAMNQKAEELGMENTYFKNTNGLPITEEGEEGNYTTAYDVALMSRELLKYPEILEYTSTWIDHLRDGESFLRNTNDLVRFYEGADGLKTGYTAEAGFGLSATASQRGMRFISVVLDAPNSKVRFRESRELLSYAFNIHQAIEIVEKDLEIDQIDVFKGKDDQVTAIVAEDLTVSVIKGEEGEVKKQIWLDQEITAPIDSGDKVGEVIVLKDGEEIGQVDLVAAEKVEEANLFELIISIFKKFISSLINYS
ncbi:D-alanyl-D-alanine carboxypeptidase [Natroniella sulfidigena]|uniref:D-alanyl-D-alanine carboxypeptidase family protein n=1 Tax=Natroniella sulfidigena TaxID=723921 RepID=UPI00200AAABB|nr:D-alanyl-D-alanine carboxypeptidase family protein [Natroniella sulfidigena]MCK8816593.1 D-alanyl-D-alanine carboxypeptidase [Natroniella sulfidigena]